MNTVKTKKIKATEKVIKRVLKGTLCSCSNVACKNKITLNDEELTRKIMCSKCYSGFYVIKEQELRINKNKKKPKTIHRVIITEES